VFQCSCSYFYYEIGRWQCHVKNFERQDSVDDSTRVHYFTWSNKDEVVWENEEKELEVNGKLYDVLSIQKSDSGVTIKCLEDDEEQGFVNGYQATFHDKRNTDNSNVCSYQVVDLKYLKVEPTVIKPMLFTAPFNYVVFAPIAIARIYIQQATPPPEC
jgi:hypothetical protein